MSFSSFYFRKMAGPVVMEFVLVFFSMYLWVRGLVHSLSRGIELSTKLADGDYTGSNLSVNSRTEIGILFNNINDVKNKTHMLVSEVHSSVDDTARVGTDLVSSMEEMTRSSDKIIDGISTINNRIENQKVVIVQTNEATDKIMSAIEVLAENIKLVSDSTAEVRSLFDTIRSLTESVKSQNESVVQAMQEQSEGGKQVLDAVRDIDDTTVKVKEHSQDVIIGGKAVVNEMQSLEKATSMIVSLVSDIVNDTDSIKSSISRVRECTIQNDEAIGKLSSEMKKFKINI